VYFRAFADEKEAVWQERRTQRRTVKSLLSIGAEMHWGGGGTTQPEYLSISHGVRSDAGGAVDAQRTRNDRLLFAAIGDGGNHDGSLPAAGDNLQVSVELTKAFANARKADAETHATRFLCVRHADAVIANLQFYFITLPGQENTRSGAVRVAMDIQQAFLNDTKESSFNIAVKAAKIRGNIEGDGNAAAFGKTLGIDA